mgnify:CR=1 FL=1
MKMEMLIEWIENEIKELDETMVYYLEKLDKDENDHYAETRVLELRYGIIELKRVLDKYKTL